MNFPFCGGIAKFSYGPHQITLFQKVGPPPDDENLNICFSDESDR